MQAPSRRIRARKYQEIRRITWNTIKKSYDSENTFGPFGKSTASPPDEMAKRLGISVKTLLAVEKGQLPPRLSFSILFRIQQEFGVSPKDLFS